MGDHDSLAKAQARLQQLREQGKQVEERERKIKARIRKTENRRLRHATILFTRYIQSERPDLALELRDDFYRWLNLEQSERRHNSNLLSANIYYKKKHGIDFDKGQ